MDFERPIKSREFSRWALAREWALLKRSKEAENEVSEVWLTPQGNIVEIGFKNESISWVEQPGKTSLWT